MRPAHRDLIQRLLVGLIVAPLVLGAVSAAAATPAPAATATSFDPPAVSLSAGQSATITIAATGLGAGATGAQFVGILSGANVNQATRPDGDLIACTFAAGGATGTSGELLTFTLTNSGGGAETISLNTASTLY